MEDLFFAVKLAQHKLSNCYTEVTPSTDMLLNSADILNLVRKSRSFRKWDNGIGIDPEDETMYTTQYQEAVLKYMENESSAKQRRVPVNKQESSMSNNLTHSEKVLGSCRSSFDPYDLCSDDEEYLTPNNVAERTPGWSDCAAHLSTAARLHLNWLPEAPQNWGHMKPNLNDYHSDPMEISSILWLLEITAWWHQQEETHSKYTDFSNVARNIFSIIPRGVRVEDSFSLGHHVFG